MVVNEPTLRLAGALLLAQTPYQWRVLNLTYQLRMLVPSLHLYGHRSTMVASPLVDLFLTLKSHVSQSH